MQAGQETEIDIPGACIRARLSPSAAYRLAMMGEFGPLRREGRRWILTLAGLDAYLARRSQLVVG